MKRLILIFAIILTTLSGFAQTPALTPQQYEASLALIAPHRPVMERDTGGTDVFHGGLVTYKHHDNEHALEHWIEEYPAEVEAYKISIQSYISSNTNTILTGLDEDIFADLKAQWVMVSHIFDLEVYSN